MKYKKILADDAIEDNVGIAKYRKAVMFGVIDDATDLRKKLKASIAD